MTLNRIQGYLQLTILILFGVVIALGQAHPPLRPLPPGVVELDGIGTSGGIVQLKDGSLMLAQNGRINGQSQPGPIYRISRDGGRTWSKPQQLNSEIEVGGMIRLKSGALAIYGRKAGKNADPWRYYFSLSRNEGKTWSTPTLIPTYPHYVPMYHSLIQLSSGRLLLTGYWEGLDMHPLDAQRFTATGWGLWRGKMLFMEGERGVQMGICITYYSDDEGKTWRQSDGGIFGWFDKYGVPNGYGGIIDLYEPTSAETKDGQVLLFARSKTGRLVESYSEDGGIHWSSALPTELASSQSPALLIRIPKTGDLLCVWNQVSGAEIRRGFLRGRLSAAISKDNGLTWEHFKTLELQKGMDDVQRITPEWPIPRRIVGNSPFPKLPDGFMMFTYPNVDIIGDKVFIRYARQWPRIITRKAGEKTTEERETNLPAMWPKYGNREAEMTGQGVLRIYPLDYFYH